MMKQLALIIFSSFIVQAGIAQTSFGQFDPENLPPIIDVHFHAVVSGGQEVSTLCPNQHQFLAADPADPNPSFIGWSTEDCSPRLYSSIGEAYLDDIVAEMERLNVTAVVFGDPRPAGLSVVPVLIWARM